MSVTVTPLTPHVGVAITGMSRRELVDREAADDCLAALHRHGVVVYRDAHLDDDDLIAFSRMLGDVAVVPTGEHDRPEIQTITLDPSKTNARLVAYRQGNFLWHIDGATEAVPQKGTLLSAREVDDAGGDTEFASTYAAYEALPDSEKAEINGLRVVHSFAAAQQRANPDASPEERASWQPVPTRCPPPAGVDPSRRPQVAAARRHRRRSRGMADREGRGAARSAPRLVDTVAIRIAAPLAARRPGHVGQHRHAAPRALPFASTSRRLLHRTTLVGEESVA